MTKRFLFSLVLCFFLLALSSIPPAQAQKDAAPIDPEPHLAFQFGTNMRFGLTVLKDPAGKVVNKRLTFSADGGSNSTVVQIDKKDYEFGTDLGKWVEKETKLPNGSKSVWAMNGIEVSQIIEIVPSQQPVEVSPGVQKRLLDTCLVRYVIENKDGKDHTVGLRIQVDTLIGSNDGVPFAVPNLGMINTLKDFATARDVPEFVQALEVPDLLKPGTVGLMTLKLGGAVEAPSRVSLTHWPAFNYTKWDVPMVSMREGRPDSCVVIYWNPEPLQANAKRELGFAYGLGRVSSSEGTGKLALTVNGTFRAGEPFNVTAYAQDLAKGTTLKLELPAELDRAEGKETEVVPAPAKDTKNSIITWKVKAPKAGRFTLKVSSSTGIAQTQQVTIQEAVKKVESGVLLPLTITGSLVLGETFTLTAKVKSPVPDQHLTLAPPPGLELLEPGEQQTVPFSDTESSVRWKIKSMKAGAFTIDVQSSAGGKASKSITILEPKTKPKIDPKVDPKTPEPKKEPKKDLTVLDARRALQMSVGNLPADLILDVDSDGRVTSLDAAIILQRVADQTRKGK